MVVVNFCCSLTLLQSSWCWDSPSINISQHQSALMLVETAGAAAAKHPSMLMLVLTDAD